MIKIFEMVGQQSTETAANKASQASLLALYLFAQSLTKLYEKDLKAKKRAEDLVDTIYGQIDTEQLAKLGLDPDRVVTKKYGWPAIVFYTRYQAYKKVVKEKWTDNPGASASEAKLLTFALNFLKTPSKDGYLKRMLSAVATTGPMYTGLFTKAVYGKMNHNAGSSIQQELSLLVKNITGRAATKMSSDTVKALREGSPKDLEDARQYTRLRTALRKQQIQDFSTYVSTNGGVEGYVSVYDANEHMYDMGYDDQLFPKVKVNDPLFVGLEGDKITYYTPEGRRLIGGIPANATQVTFMKTYNKADGSGGYLSYRTPEAKGETPTKLYTAEHKDAASSKKFSQAAKVAENMDKYVKRWTKDLASREPDTYMSAAAAVLIYLTGMRVGASASVRSVNGTASTGALTLKVSNLKLKGNVLTLSYVGKKGVKQNHTITLDATVPKGFKQAITDLLADKTAKDYVFSDYDKKGTLKKLAYSAFTAYLKATGFPAGIHKIRHARGTALMLEKLKTNTLKYPRGVNTLAQKQRYAEDFIKAKVLNPVANLLGHKKASGAPLWQTSITNYCSPEPLAKWFLANELRVPRWIPKKLADD